jgi:hypothetical protein
MLAKISRLYNRVIQRKENSRPKILMPDNLRLLKPTTGLLGSQPAGSGD